MRKLDNEPKIGTAMRRLRKERGLTIDDLTGASGLSRAYISQIETNKASPSLPTIRKICAGLGVSPAVLFEDPDDTVPVMRASQRTILRYDVERNSTRYTKMVHMLSRPSRKIEVALLELSPQHIAGDHTHPGEEVFYLLDGEITVSYGNSEYVLRAEDSIHVDSQRPHKLFNHGTTVARILVARTPPGFLDISRDETVTRANEPPWRDDDHS